MKPKKKSSKIKKPKVSSLKKKAWKVFSLYIRNRDSKDGGNFCVTCGVFKPISELHAGHFLSRRYQTILFDERNCAPQCPHCNFHLSGNIPHYYKFMQKKYGQKVIDELLTESKKLKKWTIPELQEIIRRYS